MSLLDNIYDIYVQTIYIYTILQIYSSTYNLIIVLLDAIQWV